MITITAEDVHDITVDTTKYETRIDIIDARGSTSRMEMSRPDAELLLERLQGALNKV
jgi:hypothetical protein